MHLPLHSAGAFQYMSWAGQWSIPEEQAFPTDIEFVDADAKFK
jgi:hypothetical protein